MMSLYPLWHFISKRDTIWHVQSSFAHKVSAHKITATWSMAQARQFDACSLAPLTKFSAQKTTRTWSMAHDSLPWCPICAHMNLIVLLSECCLVFPLISCMLTTAKLGFSKKHRLGVKPFSFDTCYLFPVLHKCPNIFGMKPDSTKGPPSRGGLSCRGHSTFSFVPCCVFWQFRLRSRIKASSHTDVF